VKKIGEYSVRIACEDFETRRVSLFDGRYDTGYVLTKIQAFTNTPSASNADGWATVSLDEDFDGSNWNIEDEMQIAWTGFHTTTFGAGYEPQMIIDRTNLIIEDIYVYGNTATGQKVNIYMEFDKYELEPFQGTAAIVKNLPPK
jgi:hypothetical protein